MKTFTLKQFVRIKAVFTTPAEPAESNPATSKTVNNRKTAALHRKAHMGNFFAGPHCVFDPRLF
ncbi:hypothetical protein QWZ08_19870 [Ferruginibacter paludis]|jgi:hypothetical protein|uniref:hypothetical protein n=1 Tax=Ferruginibacter paludis TaxID=1310417 RepID=UPI0025B54AF5|nr:hypothetical protein [Ferruginibacter paludis]MDN3657921.1 hypothetical protein [Ferruginibacter paludis]